MGKSKISSKFREHPARRISKAKRKRKIRRGIFILPSLLTFLNIFFGFYAIIILFQHSKGFPTDPKILTEAGLFLLIAAFFDMIDGKVAKLTHTTSEFGLQLDSLADALSFGLAPGLLAYSWALGPHKRFGWLPAFLFLICGVVRLARFNLQSVKTDKKYFIGLPIPAAAMTIVSLVLLKPDLEYKSFFSYFVIGLLYLLSFLMVSTIKFRSFKEIDVKELRPVRTIFFLGLFFIVVMHEPKLMFFLIAFLYVLSGILGRFLPKKVAIFGRIKGELLESIHDLETPDQSNFPNGISSEKEANKEKETEIEVASNIESDSEESNDDRSAIQEQEAVSDEDDFRQMEG